MQTYMKNVYIFDRIPFAGRTQAKDDKDDNDDGIFRIHPSSLNPKTKNGKKKTFDFLRRTNTN